MSSTPRTDALMGEPADILFAHACQLERELASMRHELKQCREECRVLIRTMEMERGR
jgi:hypothetical protein